MRKLLFSLHRVAHMIVIFSAMNLDRLVAILRPLAYLEAVRQQLKKDIKRQMLETEA